MLKSGHHRPLGGVSSVSRESIVKTSTSRVALGKTNTALPENKLTYLHACHIQIQAKAYSASQKGKTQTKNDSESRGDPYISFVWPQACWAPASAESEEYRGKSC